MRLIYPMNQSDACQAARSIYMVRDTQIKICVCCEDLGKVGVFKCDQNDPNSSVRSIFCYDHVV
jgi:hypothetical protein